MFTWFATFMGAGEPGAAELAGLEGLLSGIGGLRKALIYTPSVTSDPYLDDGRPPSLVVQLYFPDIAAMEAALAVAGPLQALGGLLPSQAGAAVAQQAFVSRTYPVPDARFRTPAGELPCTYLVAYEGTADDLNVWLDHYIHHHPPIMAKFPDIRQIEIYTRLDWCGFLPWPRVDHMQRNKVVFDTQSALTAALNSPVRHEMRADFHNFPVFTGANTHYPMLTRTVAGLNG
jgi:hypothetical protein